MTDIISVRGLSYSIAAFIVLLTVSVSARAATINVTPSATDALANDGQCSLREAITNINVGADHWQDCPNTSSSGYGTDDTINLPAGTYTNAILGYNDDANLSGDLDILRGLTIDGAGAANTIIDGGQLETVIHILTADPVTISGVTITGGDGGVGGIPGGGIIHHPMPQGGGGTLILNSTTVTGNTSTYGSGVESYYNNTLIVTGTTVSRNTARNNYSGIYLLYGTLTITNSTVSDNIASQYSGIYSGGATTTITNSTVSGNTAIGARAGQVHGYWGGILNQCGPTPATMTLTNSTVSGNSSTHDFGGIYNDGACATLTLNNTTVVDNSAGGVGAGIFNNGGRVSLKNSIVADNLASSSSNCGGTITSLGYNLSSDGTCGLTLPTDLPNTSPRLVSLALNPPGSTATHALCTGSGAPALSCVARSPAIDAIDVADCTDAAGGFILTDQRGVSRPQGAGCDIGSVEFTQPNGPPVAYAGADQTVEATSPSGASVTLNGSGAADPDGDPLTYTWTGIFGSVSGVSPTVTLPLGTHTVTLTVSDGQATATDTVDITVRDTTAPETIITSAVDGNGAAVAANGSTLSNSITFTFRGTDAVGVTGFQCRLDGTLYASCAGSVGHSALAIGSHTMQVRAGDSAGNVDPSPATFIWSIVTPAQAIQNLIATINGMGLPPGVAASLIAPLSNINTNNTAAACGKLNAFTNQVNAKTPPLTGSQATQLLQAANAIKASLGC